MAAIGGSFRQIFTRARLAQIRSIRLSLFGTSGKGNNDKFRQHDTVRVGDFSFLVDGGSIAHVGQNGAEDFLSRENAHTCIIAIAHQRFLHSGDAKDDGGISLHLL